MSRWNKGLMAVMEEFEEAQQGALTGTNTQFQNVLEIEEDGKYINQTTKYQKNYFSILF